jgi:hypothetical protein
MASTKTTKTNDASLELVFEKLRRLLRKHVPPFREGGDEQGMFRGKKNYHLVVPKAVAVPGAYGGKPTDLCMASLVVQKGYVGFYFMPIYMNPALQDKLAPELMKLLKGKTCFHIKTLDATLLADIDAALVLGAKAFRERGWA